ncbi:hypothetical protein [Marinobacter sp.]|uniref:hypothetical protein n=1 Tax=Marinobacter sp. TaxID=50741 RepID=UPI0019F0A607|nr:hypothetical protein [Marinobacter sp.]MBE0485700.1 hypothetical protein [Marinobacter sp.]
MDCDLSDISTADRRQAMNDSGSRSREQALARIDVNMLHRTTERVVPRVVQVIALTNPLHGVTGFRLSAVTAYKG